MDIRLSLFLEDRYVVLKLMSHGAPNANEADYLVRESINRFR